MRKLGIVIIISALLSSVLPAIAVSDESIIGQTLAMSDVLNKTSRTESITGEATPPFFVLSNIPNVKLIPLTDDQLASIKGRSCLICIWVNIGVHVGVNIGVIVPINISILSGGITQINRVSLQQLISLP